MSSFIRTGRFARRTAGGVLLAGALIAVSQGSVSAQSTHAAGLAPAVGRVTVVPGGKGSEDKVVTVPAKPPKVDIELAFDTTSSMTTTLNQAKTDAVAIVNGVKALVPDSQFSVVQFKDSTDGIKYRVEQSMTPSAPSISAAVNTLSASGGGDQPEAYNLVFHNSYTDPPLTPPGGGSILWRTGTRKFVIVFGDAQPHGNLLTQGLSGCTNNSAEPFSGLGTTSAELLGMKNSQRTLIMVRQQGPAATLPCYQSLAAKAYVDGLGVNASTGTAGALATQIVNVLNTAFANATVQLQLSSACAPPPASSSWVSFSPPSITNAPAPSTQGFTLTVTAPAGAPPGTYTCDVVALADGVDIGHQRLTIVVTPPAEPVRPLDHFKCYRISDDTVTRAESGDVSLLDQFDDRATAVSVGTLVRFCNPVEKTHLGRTTKVASPDLHLAFYAIKTDSKTAPTVVIDNQFGKGQTLNLEPPKWLAVPTSMDSASLPDPSRLSHFECYPVTNIVVDLVDPSFEHKEPGVSIGAPFAFCNAALKVHADKKFPAVSPKEHLTCYQFAFDPFSRGLAILNQFNKTKLSVAGADLLCVPSTLVKP